MSKQNKELKPNEYAIINYKSCIEMKTKILSEKIKYIKSVVVTDTSTCEPGIKTFCCVTIKISENAPKSTPIVTISGINAKWEVADVICTH
jgi:hypothetical protein